jgi:hypothetical protein
MANSKKDEVTAAEQEVSHNHYVAMGNKRNWLVGGVLVILVLLLVGALAHGRNERPGRFGKNFGGYGMMQRQGRGFMGAGGNFGGTTNQNRITGTVTAVNGSTFTVAGGGSTNDVTTNSSTQYQGGAQPKVNDTVVVFGTTNNGTFTATQVVINP